MTTNQTDHENKARTLRVTVAQRKSFKKKEKKLKAYFKNLGLEDGPNRFGSEIIHAKEKTYRSFDKDTVLQTLVSEISPAKLEALGLIHADPMDGIEWAEDAFKESTGISLYDFERVTEDGTA